MKVIEFPFYQLVLLREIEENDILFIRVEIYHFLTCDTAIQFQTELNDKYKTEKHIINIAKVETIEDTIEAKEYDHIHI